MNSASGTHRGIRRALTYPLLLAGALSLAAGCSAQRYPGRDARVVDITERDFHISIADPHLAAGTVTLSVKNLGPVSHELIVVRSEHGELPLRSDGITVNEEALQKSEVGALEPGEPGTVRELRVRLRRGHYEVFCNMAGHYFGGMRSELRVS